MPAVGKLNMKTQREYRIANAKSARRQTVECRFAPPVRFAVVVRVHNNEKP